jgi:cytochrome P450
LKDSLIEIYIYGLHHNPEEWQDPEKYIPERFDPSSKFFLTPSGTKRHPMSYGPFLGGKRICLGKTFAENIVKCILPMIVT